MITTKRISPSLFIEFSATIILLVFTNIRNPLLAQCNLVQGDQLVFNSQTQVDEFKILYPDCDSIFFSIFLADSFPTDPIISLEPFNNLRYIGGDLKIFHQPELPNLEGLDKLEQVDGLLSLFRIDELADLNGLENLTLVDTIIISSCDKLKSIDALNGLDSVGAVNILACDGIKRVNSLNNLRIASEYVSFSFCDSITELFILDNLNFVGRLTISECPNLKSISEFDFEVLNQIGIETTMLDTLRIFNSLEKLDGRLSILRNHYLKCIDGFSNLNRVGEISLNDNNNLEEITQSSFAKVDSVTNNLFISFNNKLLNLDFLKSISYVGNRVRINGNDEIETLDPLWELSDNVGERYWVFQNESLSDCDAICLHLERGGEVQVDDNLGICSDIEELIAHCETVSVHEPEDNEVNIFPNPVNDLLLIESSIRGRYEIYDTTGGLCLEGEIIQESISCRSLNSGIYFLRFISENGKQILKKFCKR